MMRPLLERRTALRAWLVFLVVAWLLVAADVLDGTLYQGDVDDRLRAIQIRHLLGGGRWFDPVLPMISMPEPYASPWSRLVDLPYLILARLFGLVLSDGAAVHLATLVWPPLLLVAFSSLFLAILRRMMPAMGASSPALAAGCALLSVLALWEFSPGRIDHHNMQLTAAFLAFYGLVRFDLKGGILAGIGTGISLLIGLEALPLLAAAFAMTAAVYILGSGAGGRFLSAAGGGLVVTLISGGLIFVGPAGLRATQCDSFSAPYLLAGVGAGLTALTGPLIALRLGFNRVWHRLLILALPGAACIGAAAFLFPVCLAGPYHMVDALSASGWLHRAAAEQTALYLLQAHQPGIFFLLLVQTVILFAAALPVWRARQEGRPQTAILWVIAALGLLMAFATLRNIRFPAAIVPLFLPLAVAALTSLRTRLGPARFTAGGFILLLAGVSVCGLGTLMVPARAAPDTIDVMAALTCDSEDFSVLASSEPGRVLAPLGLGLPIIEQAPEGFTVSAIPFHRASPGIRRTLIAFTTPDAAARRQILDQFDYIAICRPPAGLDVDAPGSLFAELAANTRAGGLTAVPGADGSRFGLWRIEPSPAD